MAMSQANMAGNATVDEPSRSLKGFHVAGIHDGRLLVAGCQQSILANGKH